MVLGPWSALRDTQLHWERSKKPKRAQGNFQGSTKHREFEHWERGLILPLLSCLRRAGENPVELGHIMDMVIPAAESRVLYSCTETAVKT